MNNNQKYAFWLVVILIVAVDSVAIIGHFNL